MERREAVMEHAISVKNDLVDDLQDKLLIKTSENLVLIQERKKGTIYGDPNPNPNPNPNPKPNPNLNPNPYL